MLRNKISNHIIHYLFAISLFVSSLPYFVWHYPYIRYGFETTVILLAIVNIKKTLSQTDFFLVGVLILILFYQSIGVSIANLISSFSLIFIFLMNNDVRLDFYKAFRNLFSILILISLIVYFLTAWFSFDIPYYMTEPLNPVKDENYKIYPFLAVYNSIYAFGNFRFAAYFDEPGVIGTLCGIFLYCEKYDLKKWYNIVLLISGIMSFSFFFIMISCLFYIFNISIKRILMIMLLLVIILFAFRNNDVVNVLVFSRFNMNHQGQFGGIRSTEEFEVYYREMISTTAVFYGKGVKNLSTILNGSSTYKSLIYANGIIWFGMVIFVFFVQGKMFVKNNKEFVLYCIFFLGLIYQRPGIFDIVFFFFLITMPQKLATHDK